VRIPRPRVKSDLPSHPEYLRVHERLVHLLQHELVIPEQVAAVASL
jgi:hypothetical protein